MGIEWLAINEGSFLSFCSGKLTVAEQTQPGSDPQSTLVIAAKVAGIPE